MTIPAAGPTYVQLPGNGSATVFAFPFKIFQATDLVVTFISSNGNVVQNSGFTVQGVDNNGGGSITFGTPPPVGTTVDIRSVTPETQSTEFANLGRFLPENHTEAFDRLTRMVQDLYRQTYLFGIHGPDQENTVWNALPGAAQRVGLLLTFDQNGQPALLPPSVASGPGYSSLVIGPPSGSGPALQLISATNWQSLLAQSTAQFTGPNVLSHANQNVALTQIMIHGSFAEIVPVYAPAAADCKVWTFYAGNQDTGLANGGSSTGAKDGYFWRTENDALSATFTFMQVTRSGAYNANQVTTQFLNGYGTVTFAPTASNGYQVVINAGGVAGFANGLEIIAGSISVDNALTIKNYNSTVTFFNITGQGVATLGPPTSTTLTTLSVTGVANNTAPVATFGGTAGNFITVTDGAGIVLVTQAGTGVSEGVLGMSSNHALSIITNNVEAIHIAANGAATLKKAQTSGWGTPTGASVISAFPGATATLAQCSAVIAQLITDLRTLGLYAT